MLAHSDELIAAVARLGPALPLAIVLAIALVEAAVLPVRVWAKAAWLSAVVLCGVAAFVLVRWEQPTAPAKEAAAPPAADRTASETAALHGLWSQWDTLSKSLPPASGDSQAASFDTFDDAVASLRAKVVSIEEQVASLKGGAAGRAINPATATKLADYLRQNGNYRVVVSCDPGDDEAYAYANQLVNLLKTAGWDANGPEATVNVVDQPTMGITVLVRDPTAPGAAKILLDAFTQFNIPHQPGIAANYAIPDNVTAELFVAKKP